MARRVSRKTMLAGLAAAGVLGAGIAAPALAFDSEGSPAPASSAASSASGSPSTTTDQDEAAFAAALAKELGIPQDKVTAALQKLRDQRKADHKPQQGDNPADRQAQLKQRLDQAVKDGKLTQEQADAISKAVQAGVLPGAGWQRPGRAGQGNGWQGKAGDWRGNAADWQAKAGGWRGNADGGQGKVRGWQGEAGERGPDGRPAAFVSALAKELGVDQDKLTAALRKVREQRKDADKPNRPEATADRQAQLKQRLDQAVKDGKLTQAEADAITKAITDHGFGGPGERAGR